MARGRTVTPEKVAEVKELKAEFPDMDYERIGKLADVSRATVGRILTGYYDPKPEPEPEPEPERVAEPEKAGNSDDLALAVMELSDRVDMLLSHVEEQNRLLKAIALAVAVNIDPKGGSTSAPVAEAIRKAVRGES